jgi:Protein of unknown function (DUF2523).
MELLGSWLLALAAPWIRKVLASLGIGVLSFTGMDAVITNVVASAKAAWSGFPAEMVMLVDLAGVSNAISIIVGAYIARASLLLFKRFGIVS